MRRLIKWLGISLVVLLLIIGVAILSFYLKSQRSIEKSYTIEVAKFEAATDSASLSRGAYLAATLCSHCHGSDLGGTAFFDDPTFGTLPASNLTSGKGGIGKNYTTADWVRSIRHGVSPEGKGLMIMPSTAFNHLDSSDLSSLIAYLMSIPPVDKDLGKSSFTFLANVMVGAGMFGDFIPAKIIDHSRPFPSHHEPAISPEYGEYLFNLSDCVACHKADLKGGKSPEPNAPPIPAIGKSSNVSRWTENQFVNTMKKGITPEGKVLDDKFMPWTAYAGFTEDDLKAILLYIRSLDK